jgi:hypothetical protein
LSKKKGCGDRMSNGVAKKRGDPIKVMLSRYPRLIIIKAAFELFSEHEKISTLSLERIIRKEFERDTYQKRA